MEPYRSLQPNAGLLLPETERVAARVIVLPTGQEVDKKIVSRVCQMIRCAVS
jgi:dTDP-4-amino-4,6-dideoxygalactose transaminase